MQHKLTTIAEEVHKVGLKINTNRSEITKINSNKNNVINVGIET
jgi:hypothetical protein